MSDFFFILPTNFKVLMRFSVILRSIAGYYKQFYTLTRIFNKLSICMFFLFFLLCCRPSEVILNYNVQS